MLSLKNGLYEKIQFLNNLGYFAILVEEDVYIYTKFEASTSSNVSSVDFCTFTGVCMTDFLINTQISELQNATTFRNKFELKLNSLIPVTIKFNRNIPYMTLAKF